MKTRLICPKCKNEEKIGKKPSEQKCRKCNSLFIQYSGN